MKVIETEEEYEELTKKTVGKLIVVKFGAQWCGPCRMIKPVLVELEDEFKDKVIFAEVDVDDAGDLAEECEISVMPTFLLYRDGKQIEMLQGANRDNLRDTVKLLANAEQSK